MEINFYTFHEDKSLPEPIPASKDIPEWYKKLDRYISGAKVPVNGQTSGTIKTCIPVLDSMTAGYLIRSSADLYITKEESSFFYQWSSNNLITFHNPDQLKSYPNAPENESVPKFNNPWVIETPKGYSCLIVTPFHRDLPFSILPGIVDTDKYHNMINFPFIPKKDFEGLIPQGTPIAQIIPFKRESWKMSAKWYDENNKKAENTKKIVAELKNKFFDRYRDIFWSKKEYR